MSAFAPAAISEAFTTIRQRIPRAQLGGIFANKPGYHNSRNNNRSGDYSVQRADDRAGDGNAASALDITMHTPADMRLMTQRLITATQNRDPRMRPMRSFFGTVNGRTVTGLDVRDNRWVTSDASHLWHVHISGYRRWATDRAAWQGIADVCTGVRSGSGGGGTTPTPTPEEDPMPKHVRLHSVAPNFNLTAGQWRVLTFRTWTPQAMSGGQSVVLPARGAMFTGTIFVTLDRVPLDQNIWLRFQTQHRGNKKLNVFPAGEQRGTTGQTTFVFTQVGIVPRDINLRALIACTVAARVTAAELRVLYW